MDYLELKIQCDPEFSEILMAELSLLPFESFVEEPPFLTGYISEQQLDPEQLDEILHKYEKQIESSSLETVKRTNWNEEWEKNYDPIVVDDRVIVAASFHELEKDYDYKLIIDPKMSFGTGHHETTHQMISSMLEMDIRGKEVLDAGCGTGVLAIMAEKMGAKKVTGVDIDEWAVENSQDNIQINNCQEIDIRLGTVKLLEGSFEVILANINKNVLLEESATYVNLLQPGSHLLLSGFYTSDNPDLIHCFENLGMQFEKSGSRKDWSNLLFFKPQT